MSNADDMMCWLDIVNRPGTQVHMMLVKQEIVQITTSNPALNHAPVEMAELLPGLLARIDSGLTRKHSLSCRSETYQGISTLKRRPPNPRYHNTCHLQKDHDEEVSDLIFMVIGELSAWSRRGLQRCYFVVKDSFICRISIVPKIKRPHHATYKNEKASATGLSFTVVLR